MGSDELYHTILGEAEKAAHSSYKNIIIGIVMTLLSIWSLYFGLLIDLTHEPLYETPRAVFVALSVLMIAEGLREYKFSVRLRRRLKDNVISAALDVLDRYKRNFRLGKILLVLFFPFVVSLFAYWLAGFAMTWWRWNDLIILAEGILLAFCVVGYIALILTTIKWRERCEARINVEMLMEEYLDRQGSGRSQ